MSARRNLTILVIWFLVLAHSSIHLAAQVTSANQEPPSQAPGVRAVACKLGGSVAYIPSKGAGPEGLAVRISPPTKPRYPDGAPIAVQVTPAPALDEARICLKENGFVDVGFQCPGGGARTVGGWEESGGRPGPEACMEALADVLTFATGRIMSLEKKSIGDYGGSTKVLTSNVGVIGWSAGGNLATVTMARHGEQFRDLAWYASWESPVLSTSDVGSGSVYQANRFYDPATGRVDYRRLRHSSEMPLWVWPPQGLRSDPSWPRGGLYLDGDSNGTFDRDADYAFWLRYRSLSAGEPRKAFYPPAVTREARDRKVFGETWPAHIATVEDVERLANVEDVMRRIPDAVQRLSQLAVIVFESERGHVTNSADHPHAIAQVNAWLAAGARWVRLNPDVHYVEAAMGKRPSREVQNPAGRKLDRASIAGLVEPEADAGGPTDAQGMAAAASELADRTYSKTWTTVLTKVLFR
jgi:hypothetical protein